MDGKIKTYDELAATINALRKRNRKIVALSGAFDLLHSGHIGFLQRARKAGDTLVVFLNSDTSIKQYKGVDRPITANDSRAALLSALTSVDYLTLFDEPDPRHLVERFMPDIYANGVEYKDTDFPERRIVESYGGMNFFIDYRTNATTDIIRKIQTGLGPARAEFPHASREEVLSALARLKQSGKRIAALSGTFDLLHRGHLFSLQEARMRGDVLVVFLNSDASVRRYKGHDRPVLTEGERRTILEATHLVDFVMLFDDEMPRELIRAVKPHVYCNGGDWGGMCPEKEALDAYGGEYRIIPYQEGYSTTAIIQRVKSLV